MSDVLRKLRTISKKNQKDEFAELRNDVDSLQETIGELSEVMGEAIEGVHTAIEKINNRMDLIDRAGTIGGKGGDHITQVATDGSTNQAGQDMKSDTKKDIPG